MSYVLSDVNVYCRTHCSILNATNHASKQGLCCYKKGFCAAAGLRASLRPPTHFTPPHTCRVHVVIVAIHKAHHSAGLNIVDVHTLQQRGGRFKVS